MNKWTKKKSTIIGVEPEDISVILAIPAQKNLKGKKWREVIGNVRANDDRLVWKKIL